MIDRGRDLYEEIEKKVNWSQKRIVSNQSSDSKRKKRLQIETRSEYFHV